mmetsp:Transcript_113971/g.254381  ORF Transcript_113971/g.254381 Transcript_113971/m.254381 type:complete len:146 (+) Transcript_113971:23-460(+)
MPCGGIGGGASGPAADSNCVRKRSTIPVGMRQRSPKKLAVEGIKENHIGTRAQTFSPKPAAAGTVHTGVIAPECTSKLDMGVSEARVVQPDESPSSLEAMCERGVLPWDVEEMPKPKSTSTEQPELMGEAWGPQRCSVSFWGGGS